jgi:ring-1,2-phenylacetyl-CoA epoxidase subunit PaaE
MYEFHNLTIKNIKKDTTEAIVLTLEIPQDLIKEYQWHAGQHLTFRRMINAEEIRRSYSIFNPINESEIQVLIKKVSGGLFSEPAQTEYKIGQKIEVMPPSGHFSLQPDDNKTYVGFVAGSGITPVMGMINQVLSTTNSNFILYYGNSTVDSTLLLNEITDLKDNYTERFSVQYFLSQEPIDVELFSGRIDESKVKKIFKAELSHLEISGYYLCGPGGMIESVTKALRHLNVSPSLIHKEQFLSEGQVITSSQKTSKIDSGVMVTIDGVTSHYEIKTGDEKTLLDAALDNDIKMPYSCKAGVCATCRCKLLEGEVELLNNYSLEPWELDDNYILSCQALPKTNKIRIDYDS